ncbi:MAG: ATP-grasp domain-containing protein, partial [Bacteroidia bacterium]|nr:ATP-grasp domain-containing protein [Bacteroidia bacterium]
MYFFVALINNPYYIAIKKQLHRVYKCLFINPIRNGKNLASYFKNNGQEVYALIEIDKIKDLLKSKILTDEKEEFSPNIYTKYFFNVDQVLESGIAFDCIIPGCESGVEICDYLCHKFGLDGNNYATTDYRRNKYVMQEQLKLNGLAYAKSKLVNLAAYKKITPADLTGFSFPIILKPATGTGTKDVYFCYNIEDINARLAQVEYGATNWTFSKTTHFVIQEFIQGTEYALDFVVHRNKSYIIVVSKYFKNFKVENRFLTTESVFLSPDNTEFSQLIEYGKKVLKTLGVSNGAAHLEFISNGENHCLIDIGARMRGGGDPWFYSKVYSIGLMEAIYDKYINNGRNLKNNVFLKYGIHIALNTSKSGIFRGLTSNEKKRLAQLPLLKELTLYPKLNQPYKKTTDLLTSI